MSDKQPRHPRAGLSQTGEDVLGAAVHDLTNAMAVLKIRLVLLQRESNAAPQSHHVIALQRAVDRACESIERLRALQSGGRAHGDPGRA